MRIPKNIKERKQYISRIVPFMKQSIIKVLTGQRRVGKSYMLFQLIEKIQNEEPDASVIYINCENFEFESIRTAIDLHQYIESRREPGRLNYIFIDEIQEIEDFEKALRSLVLNEENDIYVTGSNAHLLSGELGTYLSGRYVEFKIYSLSYPEFLQFHELSDSFQSYDKYCRYGGLPYLVNLALRDEIVDDYLQSVYSAIIFRDVVARYKVRNIAFLEKLIQFLAENTGSLFSAKNISDYLKSQRVTISVNQIQTYVSHLVNAFLIHRVERYDMVGKRIFEVGEKYYFENLGLRNTIIGYRITDKAKILENVVYNHLLYDGYKINIGYNGNKEIDFICEKASEKLYVQVALKLNAEKTIEREFGNLLKIPDNFPKIVVSEDDFSGNTYKGIRHYSIRDFLMHRAPK
ncbi:ATP-binding protein [Gabonibacter massiliensis]|uniref:ATP-binding protein n=1 Tax=Gabonibacter massiliensis TaxID=1720195 RepID=UPI00073E2362|nr:ATP-binding protein [Gabonibacter massiliensis]